MRYYTSIAPNPIKYPNRSLIARNECSTTSLQKKTTPIWNWNAKVDLGQSILAMRYKSKYSINASVKASAKALRFFSVSRTPLPGHSA